MKELEILKKIRDSDYEAYFVGGYVRDLFLKKPNHDIDIVTNALPSEIKSIFPENNIKTHGEAYLVTIVDDVQISTYRNDNYLEGKFSDVKVQNCETVEADLIRRDFTFNAIAFDPLTRTYIDPFGGILDLQHGIIRFIGNPYKRILEDPHRIIRGCRFYAITGFEFERKTLRAIKKKISDLTKITPERIQLELKYVLARNKPSRFFTILKELGGLQYIFPA